MFTLNEKQHKQQTLTLPSSFLGSAFSGCHNIGNFWDNPKGAGIVYKAAAPARCLLNQNKIHSAQTLVHSWVAQDNLKQAGWALVKYSAGPHAACDLSCYRSLSLSLSQRKLCFLHLFFRLCVCSLPLAAPQVLAVMFQVSLCEETWPNTRSGERARASCCFLLFLCGICDTHSLTHTDRKREWAREGSISQS